MTKEPTPNDNEMAPAKRNERSSSVNVIYSRPKVNPEPPKEPPQSNTPLPQQTTNTARTFDYYEERNKFFDVNIKKPEYLLQQSGKKHA